MDGETSLTRRAGVPFLEERLGTRVPVLDHGFVSVVDYMGNDAAIVEAARVSTLAGSKTAVQDRGLIRHLMRHGHTSPFEMCEIKLHVRLPIFVARQWIRHRTANVNEVSGRYSILSDDFYLPPPAIIAGPSSTRRQGRGEPLAPAAAEAASLLIQEASSASIRTYHELLSGPGAGGSSAGLARELARLVLPLNLYTEWIWKIDLHNLLHFLELRLSSDAQAEIQDYAQAIAGIVAGWVPLTYEAFLDYRVESITLSRHAAVFVQRRLAGEPTGDAEAMLTPSERETLVQTLGLAVDEGED